MSSDSSTTRARVAYRKAAFDRLAADGIMFGAETPASTDTPLQMETLRAIECGLDELEKPLDLALVRLTLRVLEEVSAGRHAQAI